MLGYQIFQGKHRAGFFLFNQFPLNNFVNIFSGNLKERLESYVQDSWQILFLWLK